MAKRLDHAACRNTNELKFKPYIHEHGENNQMIGMCCEVCLSEWVLPKYLSNDNNTNETIIVAGQEFGLIRKRTLAESQFRIQKHHTTFPDHEAAEQCIKAAEHISYETYKGFIMHHAIVKAVKKDESGSRFTLIHWKNLGDNNYEVVEEENVNLRDKAKRVIRCDYPEDYVRADSTELVIARATAWKGKTNYGGLSNNCEHFATFCKVGCPQSFQQNLIIAKIKHILQQVCGFGVTVVTGAAKKTLARAAVGVFGDAAEYGAQGAYHFISVSTQCIGIGVAIAINGIIFFYDVGKAYKEHKKGDLSKSEFKDRIWRKFITCVERIFYTGLFPAACAVGLGLLVPSPAVALAVPVLIVGAIIGGVLATATEGFGRTKVGCVLSFMIRPILDHSDKMVKSIEELHIGDHAVIARWSCHPRCHIIIKDINKEEQTMRAIRFKQGKGVVEELLPFEKPLYKVIYKEYECFPPNEVIERAAKKKRKKTLEYNIFYNNCKSFARWCKTGRLPGPRGSVLKGYEEDENINKVELDSTEFKISIPL